MTKDVKAYWLERQSERGRERERVGITAAPLRIPIENLQWRVCALLRRVGVMGAEADEEEGSGGGVGCVISVALMRNEDSQWF